ncbi:hypothetical protein SMACR_00375 [Sordaria macrospora]|uniref:WGS project CABT00000000 data, contig 2.1 n=2 Tax=Sordaria macrospora TaxID=5147 RepID=F7VKY0_SORMK|nr:uncharacterized protein SMAC_00375 [Sordaria macrospora k-hell]KAA8630825.1 hypothetical protein SMACR_00375 [Sordaria macrospora]WPJ59117.1 hypothetical protein SMAC4_00375 [Sordaria macrospora]CCC06157.1 unnamed protein product [Sordaria macrospora k-hell]
MATNSAAGNGAIQSPSFSPTANPTFASQGQQPPLTSKDAPVSSETKAQILGNANHTTTSDASTAGKAAGNGAKEGGKGASEHAGGSSKEEQGVAAAVEKGGDEGWGEEVKDLERRIGAGGGQH